MSQSTNEEERRRGKRWNETGREANSLQIVMTTHLKVRRLDFPVSHTNDQQGCMIFCFFVFFYFQKTTIYWKQYSIFMSFSQMYIKRQSSHLWHYEGTKKQMERQTWPVNSVVWDWNEGPRTAYVILWFEAEIWRYTEPNRDSAQPLWRLKDSMKAMPSHQVPECHRAD